MEEKKEKKAWSIEGLDFPFQARSSVEVKKMFQHQIKQEKIEKLHERLQGNNREMPQGIVEVVDGKSFSCLMIIIL